MAMIRSSTQAWSSDWGGTQTVKGRAGADEGGDTYGADEAGLISTDAKLGFLPRTCLPTSSKKGAGTDNALIN